MDALPSFAASSKSAKKWMNDWVAEGVASDPHDFTEGDHALLLFFQVFLLLHCQHSTETQPGVLYHYTSTNYQLVHSGENLEQ